MKCSKCGFDNLGAEKYCLNCNHILKPENKKQTLPLKKLLLYLIPGLMVVGILSFLLLRNGFKVGKEQYIQSSGKDPSSLENVEFPSEVSQYPQDWPADLTFPTDFTLVDSSSGTLPEGSKNGWSMKLRYDASPSEAEAAATSFLEGNGWSIVENQPLDSIGFSILIQRNYGSGIVIIDADPEDSSRSLILATIFE